MENVLLSKDLTWTDIEAPGKPDMNFLKDELLLPMIYVNDLMRAEQLPKYERYMDGHFLLLRVYNPTPGNAEISVQKLTDKLAIFIRKSEIVTIHNQVIFPFRKFLDLRKKERDVPEIRQLIHSLIRVSVLSYEDAISNLQANYELFEKEVLSKDNGKISNKDVYEFRRKIYVIKLVMQLMQQTLYNSRDFWGPDMSYMQDIKENIEQMYYKLDSLTHNSDQLFALNLSMNEQRNNDVMKILTVFSSIMLPLTFIASFYGMNFSHIPGLNSTTGLIGALVLMFTTTFVTIWFFNKKQWFKSM